MKTDGIMFDLDGTLWDSIKPVTESWNRVIEKLVGKEYRITTKDMHDSMGLQMEDIGRKLFSGLSEEVRKNLLDACCIYENEYVGKTGGILFDGVEETLKELSAQYPLFLISNCQAGYIEAFFQAHGLEKYFQDYENPGRTGLDKAGNIRLVAERNGLSCPVYVGDTKGDCDSAKKAGVPFVFARYGFGQVEEKECSKIVDEISQLKKLLRSC